MEQYLSDSLLNSNLINIKVSFKEFFNPIESYRHSCFCCYLLICGAGTQTKPLTC